MTADDRVFVEVDEQLVQLSGKLKQENSLLVKSKKTYSTKSILKDKNIITVNKSTFKRLIISQQC